MDSINDDLLAQAVAAFGEGDQGRAAALFKALLALDPGHAVAHHQLGVIAIAAGDLRGGQDHLSHAAALAPWEPQFHNNLGVALNALGDPAAAQEAFEAALALDDTFAQAVNNLGAALEAQGDGLGAIVAYRRALDIDPAYVEAHDNLDLACAKAAPAWHFPMMADTVRNDAYEAAIIQAVRGRRVLDIGTGSGLLAMMAARAGAVAVDTCETVAAIAATARRIVAANGLAGRVTVHAKHSEALEVGADLTERAEVLVTETFASGVLSEAVLPTLEHARRCLLTPDAQIIPRAAFARGYLVGGDLVEGQAFAPRTTGFDLSGFDVFAPRKVGIHLDRVHHEALSEDFEIFAFDLTQASFPAERRDLAVKATRAGRCVGVAQWLKLDLDEHVSYENRPAAQAGANGWMHVFYRFDEPVELAVGDAVRLIAAHSRKSMMVTLA